MTIQSMDWFYDLIFDYHLPIKIIMSVSDACLIKNIDSELIYFAVMRTSEKCFQVIKIGKSLFGHKSMSVKVSFTNAFDVVRFIKNNLSQGDKK